MKKWLSLRSLALSLPLVAAGVLLAGAGNLVLHQTNTSAFCTSCHSMTTVAEEYRASTHFSNGSGVIATCSDCHVPKATGPLLVAKVMAAKDVWHELLGTIDSPDKFEARRWHLANLVWDKMKATDSRECRSCHAFSRMDLAKQGRSTARRHQRAEEKGTACIECHQGIAHREPEPPLDPIAGVLYAPLVDP